MSAKNSERDFTNIITQSQNEIVQYCSIISDYFIKKSKTIDELAENKQILDFLHTCDTNTETIRHSKYDEVISVLKKIKEDSDEIYLAFLGIKCKDDTIDNTGRSRQHECSCGIRESYSLSQRPWYIDTINDSNDNTVTITMPVRDTSDSYVICVTKLIRDANGTEIGIAAIDLLMRNIASLIKSKNHIIIFTKTGEIVYNSESNIRYVLEKRFNINLLLGPDILHDVRLNEVGYKICNFEGDDCVIAYGQLVKNKFYIISINK